MPMTTHRNVEWFVLWMLVLTLAGPVVSPGLAQEKDTTWNRALPIGAQWALQQGIDLPNPFGIGVFLVTMTRDIEVYDVRVKLPGDEPVSINDVASFNVTNHTTLGAVKVDAWILQLLNLYVLAGHTWTDTRLNVAVTIERRFHEPVVINAT